MPWPLVKLLRSLGLDVAWMPETEYRGIRDSEVVDLANNSGRIILTRDSDFLAASLRRRIRYGLVYIAELVRKDNVEILARSIVRTLEALERKPLTAIVASSTIELHPLIP